MTGIETFVSFLWFCDCLKIRCIKVCVMYSGCHPLWKSVAVFPLCVCQYVRSMCDFWPPLIIPQSTNKSQTLILSWLPCAASLMSKKCYQLFQGQIGGRFLCVDTWCSSSAITEPITITSLTCPTRIGLEQPLNRIRAPESVSQGCWQQAAWGCRG